MRQYIETRHIALSRLPNGRIDIEQVGDRPRKFDGQPAGAPAHTRLGTLTEKEVNDLREFFNENQ